jgi:hypothetical protein
MLFQLDFRSTCKIQQGHHLGLGPLPWLMLLLLLGTSFYFVMGMVSVSFILLVSFIGIECKMMVFNFLKLHTFPLEPYKNCHQNSCKFVPWPFVQ